jgi:hypothetical protein
MPIHDWTIVDAGIFHAFHHDWITEISRALNGGLLPPNYYALPEQFAGGLGPDVLTLHSPAPNPVDDALQGGVALAEAPPQVRFRMQPESSRHAARAKTVTVRHVSQHQVVAMIEIVSPGNKNSANGLNAFVSKAREMLAAGVHLLLIDLFPPSTRDPEGIHRAIWADDCGPDYALPNDKLLACVSYIGGIGGEAFEEPLAVGDTLPSMPLFLTPDVYVSTPLESTYQIAWQGLAAYWREVLSGARLHKLA